MPHGWWFITTTQTIPLHRCSTVVCIHAFSWTSDSKTAGSIQKFRVYRWCCQASSSPEQAFLSNMPNHQLLYTYISQSGIIIEVWLEVCHPFAQDAHCRHSQPAIADSLNVTTFSQSATFTTLTNAACAFANIFVMNNSVFKLCMK